jgi:hypothetical protein
LPVSTYKVSMVAFEKYLSRKTWVLL